MAPTVNDSSPLTLQAWHNYLDLHSSRNRTDTEKMEIQRRWVESHHQSFWKAYEEDLLKNFWDELGYEFLCKHGRSLEAIEEEISLALYLVRTLFGYMDQEGLWTQKGVSLAEAEAKCFSQLDESRENE
ncbi:hypothetical protein C8J56DRAFT_1172903 [Mycena floridula]|nr:hypothetical protein C8J56DRAFT_1172903 [Mycena floridula]